MVASASDAAARTEMGRLADPASPTLVVTFSDRPDQGQVARRLHGLGPIGAVVPEIGIWQLRPQAPATARRRVLAREGVTRVEWSMARKTTDLQDQKPPGPVLPPAVVPPPTDFLFADGAGQWSLHRGNWNPGLTGNTAPTIAILDSGLDTSHEEYRTPGLVVSPYSSITKRAAAPDVSSTGHGTHVAGIAVAPMNGIGVVGVSPATPTSSRIMPVQISNSRGESNDPHMMQGIRWAVNRGAKVINISSGGPGYSQAFQDTVNWAYRRGVVIVASVGNEGLDENEVNFPAGYDHVIGVSAQCNATVTSDCPRAFGRARFSNYNYSVDVVAPGVDMLSTIPTRVRTREVIPGYGYKEGTSMAAPYVAGTVALIMASHPGASPAQVTEILQTTASRGARRLARTSTDGWGIVNPAAAVQAPTPVDDLAEPNDDVKFIPKNQTVRLKGKQRRVLRASADFNNDQFDVYAVAVAKGQRVRVTLSAPRGRLDMAVFRSTSRSVSPRILSDRQLERQLLGTIRRTTPGTRSVVFTAPATGRYFVSIAAVQGGGRYTLAMQRL